MTDIETKEVETATPSIEEQAARMGWRPKEEFHGPEDKWRSAEEFVERGLNELPVLRDRYRALDERYVKDVGELKNQVKEMGEVLNEFREFSSKAEQRSYERAKKELEAKRAAAVAHGDTETFQETQAEIEALNKEAAAKTVPVKTEPKTESNQPQIDPYVPVWVNENPWFERDVTLKNVATAIHVALMQEKPGMSLRDNLAEVRAEILARFPEKFENHRRNGPAAVSESSGGSGPRRGKGKSYDDLPADAKKACDRFVKQIPGFTKEQYTKQYFADAE